VVVLGLIAAGFVVVLSGFGGPALLYMVRVERRIFDRYQDINI
jgi:hypothetical protein